MKFFLLLGKDFRNLDMNIKKIVEKSRKKGHGCKSLTSCFMSIISGMLVYCRLGVSIVGRCGYMKDNTKMFKCKRCYKRQMYLLNLANEDEQICDEEKKNLNQTNFKQISGTSLSNSEVNKQKIKFEDDRQLLTMNFEQFWNTEDNEGLSGRGDNCQKKYKRKSNYEKEDESESDQQLAIMDKKIRKEMKLNEKLKQLSKFQKRNRKLQKQINEQ